MMIKITWDFDYPTHLQDNPDAHDIFANQMGVPTIVDLHDYVKKPEECSEDYITDVLTDEHGWLIETWQVTERKWKPFIKKCNVDLIYKDDVKVEVIMDLDLNESVDNQICDRFGEEKLKRWSWVESELAETLKRVEIT